MRYFTKDHEWAELHGDVAMIGITHYAQKSLGDVVYLELPEVGRKLEQGKIFGVVESVKAVSDLYAPLSGEVLESHADLVEHPEWVNESAEEKAWMLKVRLSNTKELEKLLSQEQYGQYLKEGVK